MTEVPECVAQALEWATSNSKYWEEHLHKEDVRHRLAAALSKRDQAALHAEKESWYERRYHFINTCILVALGAFVLGLYIGSTFL